MESHPLRAICESRWRRKWRDNSAKSSIHRCMLTHDVDDVFDCERHAAQRKIDIRVLCLPSSSLHVEPQISANRWINRFNASPQSIYDFSRGNFTTTQQRLQVGDCQRRQIFLRHSTTFGTIKRLFAFRGALLSAWSAVNQSCGASSRSTLKIGRACAAVSTWFTSA